MYDSTRSKSKYLDHMLVKFEQNRMVRTIQNLVLFDKNKKSLTIFDKVLTPFWKTFLWLKQLFDAKILIQRLLSFSVPKLRHSHTCNQVKSGTKHGRPDQSQRKLTVALKRIIQTTSNIRNYPQTISMSCVYWCRTEAAIIIIIFIGKFYQENGRNIYTINMTRPVNTTLESFVFQGVG